MSRFFISYRRGDSAGHTGRLNDTLAQRFGHDVVFRDIEDLAPGVDFAAELDRALSECSAMLVVIGRTWATVADESGRRLFRDGDFVRHEVSAALARDDVTVIPVLVDGAELPAAADLPADLQGLRGRNAIEITDGRWDYDMQRLGDALAVKLGLADIDETTTTKNRWIPFGIAAGVVAALAVAAASIVVLSSRTGNTPETTILNQAAETTTTEIVAFDIAETTVAAVAEVAEITTTSTTTAPIAVSDVPTFAVESLLWTKDSEEAGDIDWIGATAYCEQLNVLGREFRLPTIEELETIVDAFDVDAFDRKVLRVFHDGLGSNWIWSSEMDGDASAFAYDFIELTTVSLAVDFDQGAHALCVSDSTG